jgi:hypothetical protein
MSKALLLMGKHTFRTDDGKLHNWALELSRRIISLQSPDGSWINGEAERWLEGNPSLVTAYAVEVLNNCREELADQAKFLEETPKRIAALQAQLPGAGEKRSREIQEEIILLREAMQDLNDSRR